MRLHIFFLFILIANIVTCTSLPVLESTSIPENQYTNTFLKSKYRLTHSIKFDLPTNDSMLAIGVTVADPKNKSIDAVLMSVEGFVLFDARYKNNSLSVNRSVPPLDSNDFAGALIDDIELFYFSPVCSKTEYGKHNDKYITRYYCEDNIVTDVAAIKNGTSEISKYSNNDLIRTVNILSVNEEGIPEKIELIAPGFFGYTLYLELITSEKVD